MTVKPWFLPEKVRPVCFILWVDGDVGEVARTTELLQVALGAAVRREEAQAMSCRALAAH